MHVDFVNSAYPTNTACIYDDVIRSRQDSIIKLKAKKSEYPVFDFMDQLKGTPANLRLQIQVVPWVGIMNTFVVVGSDFVF